MMARAALPAALFGLGAVLVLFDTMLDLGKVIFLDDVDKAEESAVPRTRQFFERRADDYIAQRNR